MFTKKRLKKEVLKCEALVDKSTIKPSNCFPNQEQEKYTYFETGFEDEKASLFSLLTDIGVKKEYQKECLQMLYEEWSINEKYKPKVISAEFIKFIKECVE